MDEEKLRAKIGKARALTGAATVGTGLTLAADLIGHGGSSGLLAGAVVTGATLAALAKGEADMFAPLGGPVAFSSSERPGKSLWRKIKYVATGILEEQAESESADMPPLEDMRRLPPTYDFEAEDELAAPMRKPSGVVLFSSVLRTFRPSLDRIYLGTTETGEQIFCRAEDLCHVAIAGATQGGKSSLQRMLMAQLCSIGASVLLLNPHYSRFLRAKKEDWTPFEGKDRNGRDYLLYPPMECRRYEVIGHYLKQVAEMKLPERLDRFARGESTGRPYFLVLDEMPDIVKHVPGASGYLDDILRQGAKVGIFVLCASQDFLVKTLKLEGGAVRECYRTAFYVGGDATTAKTLLDMPANQIDEDALGQGTVMLRNWKSLKRAQMAYVPLVDNEALYQLLGPSTYTAERANTEDEDELTAYPAGGGVESRETPLDMLTARRYHSHGTGKEAQRQRVREREQRLRGMPSVPATSEPVKDDLLERGIKAYRQGAISQTALAAAVGISPWEARMFQRRVKEEIEKRDSQG